MTPADLATLHSSAFDAAWSEAEFAGLLVSNGVFIADEPGGFILARQIADQAEILTLAVAPACRRAGVGRRLVWAAMAQAAERGAVRLFLEVAIDNQAAAALYSALGFSEIGRRRGYYRRTYGAVDAVVLGLDL